MASARVRGVQSLCKRTFFWGHAKIKWPKSEEFFDFGIIDPPIRFTQHFTGANCECVITRHYSSLLVIFAANEGSKTLI